MTNTCISCRNPSVHRLIGFGAQPPSNRFEQADALESASHPLTVGQCTDCRLLQLIDPMPPDMVRPRFEWLSYNEPEGHLDDLVARLCDLSRFNKNARIVGLTYKDDSTLRRFNRLGYSATYRYEPSTDLGLQDKCAGLESIQAAITPATVSELADRHGVADLLLVRHVLEHAHDPIQFLQSLRKLVRPKGYLLFEMPDCTKFVDACDYSFVWEEHITYFSSGTLAALVSNAGLALEQTILYPYPLEDSLIGIVCNGPGVSTDTPTLGVPASAPDSKAFADRYTEIRDLLHARLGMWRQQGRRIAIFGAGHLAAKFINLYGLSDFIECVIDDHPSKQGLSMPGSRLPIRSSERLDSIDICLLALNVESEQKVVAKHQPFVDRGGRFLSIFALNANSIYDAGAT